MFFESSLIVMALRASSSTVFLLFALVFFILQALYLFYIVGFGVKIENQTHDTQMHQNELSMRSMSSSQIHDAIGSPMEDSPIDREMSLAASATEAAAATAAGTINAFNARMMSNSQKSNSEIQRLQMILNNLERLNTKILKSIDLLEKQLHTFISDASSKLDNISANAPAKMMMPSDASIVAEIGATLINTAGHNVSMFVPIPETVFSYKSPLIPSKIVVSLGCAKDIADYVPDLLTDLLSIGQYVAYEHHIVLYESSSGDTTYERLKEEQAMHHVNDSIVILHGDTSDEPRRTVRLATCRNTLMQYVWQHHSAADYVFIYDLDDMFPVRIFDVLDYIVAELESEIYYNGPSGPERMIEWDVLTFNRDGHYYDAWALRTDEYPNNCFSEEVGLCLFGYEISDDVKLQIDSMSTLYYEVNSAFAGFGIYRLNATLGCEYNGYPNMEVDCEHVAFHFCMTKKHGARHRISKVTMGISYGN